MTAPQTHPDNTHQQVQHLLARAWIAFFAAIVLCCLGDALIIGTHAGLTLQNMARLIWYLLALSMWSAIPCAFLSVLFCTCANAATGRLPAASRPMATGAILGLFAGLMALVITKPWEASGRWFNPTYLIVPTAIVSGVVVARVRQAWSPRTFGLAVVGLSTALFVLDATLMSGLYIRLHNLAAATYITALAIALWPAVGHRAMKRILLFCVGVALLAQTAHLVDTRMLRSAATNHGVVEPKLRSAMHALVDLDRDGYSPLLGGNDCNDLDKEINPAAFEVFGNHIDDNCNGLTDPTDVPSEPGSQRSKPTDPPVDVYVFLADGLRADLGGLDPKAFEFLTKMTQTAMSFPRAYTPYPSTYRAVASILVGRYWRCVKPGNPNLLRLLRHAGYDVQLWMGNDRLSENSTGPSIVDPGRAKGDPFRVPAVGKNTWTDALVADVLEDLTTDAEAPPRFRWLQFFDTHAPFTMGDASLSPIERYRTGARHELAAIGKILAALDATPRGRRAVLVLLADHGEEFGEHGSDYHAANLYEETVRVPFLMRLPGIAPRVVNQPAVLLDLAPTLASYLALPFQRSWQGHDWLRDTPPTRQVVTHTEPVDNWGGLGLPEKLALVEGRYKLVYNLCANDVQLFDLEVDPGEHHSIALANPKIVKALSTSLAQWQDRADCRR